MITEVHFDNVDGDDSNDRKFLDDPYRTQTDQNDITYVPRIGEHIALTAIGADADERLAMVVDVRTFYYQLEQTPDVNDGLPTNKQEIHVMYSYRED